ncbi:hypothetical protein V1524DRAFT_171675 [Lipomyces starkeyi]
MGIAPPMTHGKANAVIGRQGTHIAFPDKVSMPFARLDSRKLHHESSTSTAAYLATSSTPSFSNSVFMTMSVSTSSVKELPQIRGQSAHGVFGITYQQAERKQSRSPKATRTLRIEYGGRVIEWNLENARLNLSRLRNYIRSAFFIEDQRQFSILYGPPLVKTNVPMDMH